MRIPIFSGQDEVIQVRRDFLDTLGLQELEGVDQLEQDEADFFLPRRRVQLGGGGQVGAVRRQRFHLHPGEDGYED